MSPRKRSQSQGRHPTKGNGRAAPRLSSSAVEWPGNIIEAIATQILDSLRSRAYVRAPHSFPVYYAQGRMSAPLHAPPGSFLDRPPRPDVAPAASRERNNVQMDAEKLYDPVLAERTAVIFCRKFRFADDGADFRQEVHLKLKEDGCARLAKFRNSCSLASFYYTVVRNLAVDYRRKNGAPRWHASPEAKREGPAAVELEALRHRDQVPRDEAVQITLSHNRFGLSERELRALATKLRPRIYRRTNSGEDVDTLPGADSVDLLLEKERQTRKADAHEKLRRAMAQLPPDEALAVKMLGDGFPIAYVATFITLGTRPYGTLLSTS